MVSRPNFKIQMTGVEALNSTLKNMQQDVRNKINSVAINAAGAVLREAVLNSLSSSGIGVKTGNLKNSIMQLKAKIGRNTNETTIYAQKKKGFHAHLLEYGHQIKVWDKQPYNPTTGRFSKVIKFGNRLVNKGFVRARPFFRPAVDSSTTKVVQTYSKEVMEGINGIHIIAGGDK